MATGGGASINLFLDPLLCFAQVYGPLDLPQEGRQSSPLLYRCLGPLAVLITTMRIA